MKTDRGNWVERRTRLRFAPPKYEDRLTLEVAGVTRTYWVPPAEVAATADDPGPPPLLLGLHGLNSSGSRLAWWSGLTDRGPLAGFRCVFPDALGTVWDDHGCGRVDGADDEAFIEALVEHLSQTGAADAGRVVVTGVSTGSTFAERLLRSGTLDAQGLVLVCGTARVASSATTKIAASGVHVAVIAGTDDPITPYEGGPSRGPLGRPGRQQVAAVLLDPGVLDFVAVEALVAEWVAAIGCQSPPTREVLASTTQGFPVERLTWSPEAPGGAAVTLYRITGGGHGWPNGKQYLPARFLGRIPQGFDATGLVLEFARAAISGAAV